LLYLPYKEHWTSYTIPYLAHIHTLGQYFLVIAFKQNTISSPDVVRNRNRNSYRNKPKPRPGTAGTGTQPLSLFFLFLDMT
jgi:hypothetical protein